MSRPCAKLSQVLAILLATSLSAQEPRSTPVTHLVNGKWFDGTRFVPADFYIEDGLLTHTPHERRAYRTVDLQGRFIVPAYGDAHEHNFDSVQNTPEVTRQYLTDGIFYAQGMTDSTDGAAEVVATSLVNTPATVDVTYAHGSLTAPQGHPKEIYESLAHGFYYPSTPEQRALVLSSNTREGIAYWQLDTPAELDAKWPKILAAHPDLIKVIIVESEHFTPSSHEYPELGKGLDPALVPLIVKRAHSAGLKVAAHIDTAADFHVAVAAGVDELGHLPGYGINAKDDLAVYHLADADIAQCAAQHCKVQATASLAVNEKTPPTDLAPRQSSQRDNLRRLKAAGIPILVGSDRYAQDALHEANYLHDLGLWSNLEMLRMWSVTTPQTIFPKRKIAELKPGYEATFLVLSADPLLDFSATHAITGRWKQGSEITLALPVKAP